MDIERINENTVKFFLSYIDIEERGFTREEVWYNREKSEELFWEMMDEVNDEAEFEVEGPLWIQVHAMNSGIEVTVTRAQISKDGSPLENPFSAEDPQRMFQSETDIFENFEEEESAEYNSKSLEWTDNIFVFNDFEDLIALTGRMTQFDVSTSLYTFENKFYLHVVYPVDTMDDAERMNLFSVLSEFGLPSNVTIHRLKEYGTVTIEKNVFETIQTYFN